MSRVDFLGTALKFRKRKKTSQPLVYSLHKTWIQTCSRLSRAMRANVQKSMTHVQNCFFLNKTIVFWMFSLLSLSSSLKLPISPDDNLYTVAYRQSLWTSSQKVIYQFRLNAFWEYSCRFFLSSCLLSSENYFFSRSKIVGLARLLYYFRNASFDFGFTALIIFTNIKMHFFINFKASPQN